MITLSPQFLEVNTDIDEDENQESEKKYGNFDTVIYVCVSLYV